MCSNICVISGPNYTELNVTYDGHVLAPLKEKDSYKALCLQFGALFLFDAKYEYDSEGKPLPEISDYFRFVSTYFWDIRVKHQVSKSTGKLGKKKRIGDNVLELWEKILAYHELKNQQAA